MCFYSAIGNLNISTISLNGVAEALEKHAKEGAESKGVKAHFNMDDSGILNLLNVELVSEKSSVTVNEEEGTFSILGSTITKFFAGLCAEAVQKMMAMINFCCMCGFRFLDDIYAIQFFLYVVSVHIEELSFLKITRKLKSGKDRG